MPFSIDTLHILCIILPKEAIGLFSDRLKNLRIKRDLTQKQVAELLEINSRTYSSYENNEREPNSEMLIKLADCFSVTIDYLIGRADKPNETYKPKPEPDPGPEVIQLRSREERLMELYSRLNNEGKNAVDDYTIMVAETPKYTSTPIERVQTALPYYDLPVSAGAGQYLDDSGYIMLDLLEAPPPGAQFVVRVCGDSMEPTYKDGDKLYIEPTPQIKTGEVGIFSVNGDVYVKEYGAGQLLSHNLNYQPIPLQEGDSVHCFGRVVGVCVKYR